MEILANKPLTIKEKLIELLGVKEDPSISIIINKDVPSPQNEKFRLELRKSIKDAVKMLGNGQYENRLTTWLKERLEALEKMVVHERDFHSVIIFLSPQREEILLLPFELKNRVVVDDTFEIRPLLRAVNRSFQYDVIVLSKKKTAFYNGYQRMLKKVDHERLPEGVGYYMDNFIGMNIDPSKAETEALKLYVHDIDHFIRTYTEMHTPLIVMGDEKLVSCFKNKSRQPGKILAVIKGSYDNERTSAIAKKINEELEAYIRERDKKLLSGIRPDIDRMNYVSGIQEAWTVAAMKEARVLLVEQGYEVEGYSINGGLFLTLSKPEEGGYNYHADAVDDLAEMVLLQGGEVYFVTPGMLEQYDRIVETTRY